MLWLQLCWRHALLVVHSTHNLQDSNWHPSVKAAASGHQVPTECCMIEPPSEAGATAPATMAVASRPQHVQHLTCNLS